MGNCISTNSQPKTRALKYIDDGKNRNEDTLGSYANIGNSGNSGSNGNSGNNGDNFNDECYNWENGLH